jgi:hypothetical protein
VDGFPPIVWAGQPAETKVMTEPHADGCDYDGEPHRGPCVTESPIKHGQCTFASMLGTTHSHTHEGERGMWLFPGEAEESR